MTNEQIEFLEGIDQKISDIHDIIGEYKTMTGYRLERDGIMVFEEQYYSGCGREENEFFVPWSDFAEPLDFFIQKEAERKVAEQKRHEEEKVKAELRKEEQERKKYEELKKKFEK